MDGNGSEELAFKYRLCFKLIGKADAEIAKPSLFIGGVVNIAHA